MHRETYIIIYYNQLVNYYIRRYIYIYTIYVIIL